MIFISFHTFCRLVFEGVMYGVRCLLSSIWYQKLCNEFKPNWTCLIVACLTCFLSSRRLYYSLLWLYYIVKDYSSHHASWSITAFTHTAMHQTNRSSTSMSPKCKYTKLLIEQIKYNYFHHNINYRIELVGLLASATRLILN